MAAQRKPNLILFLPDQQRADTLARYGGMKIHAPNLNKLASESVIFERAYVTHPVCTPSRSSLMTGTWPHINGCTRNSVPLDRQFRVLPELMEDKDYRSAYIGKWHLGRSEEHTSELQSRFDLVCRLLLEKKKENKKKTIPNIQKKQTQIIHITITHNNIQEINRYYKAYLNDKCLHTS